MTLGAAAGAAMLYGYKPHHTRSIASLGDIASPFSVVDAAEELKKIKEELVLGHCDQLQNENKKVSPDSQLVIFKMSHCDHYEGKKVVSYNMRNISNGYAAEIFKNKNNLSTDYIQIQSGENIIEFEISLNDGQKISKKIKISRY